MSENQKIHPQNDFSNAKVGDSVYSLVVGNGFIQSINKEKKTLIASFNEVGVHSCFRFDGTFFSDNETLKINPVLYHSKPEIIPAKRLVEKKIEGFVHITDSGDHIFTGEKTTRYNHYCRKGEATNIAATLTYTIQE